MNGSGVIDRSMAFIYGVSIENSARVAGGRANHHAYRPLLRQMPFVPKRYTIHPLPAVLWDVEACVAVAPQLWQSIYHSARSLRGMWLDLAQARPRVVRWLCAQVGGLSAKVFPTLIYNPRSLPEADIDGGPPCPPEGWHPPGPTVSPSANGGGSETMVDKATGPLWSRCVRLIWWVLVTRGLGTKGPTGLRLRRPWQTSRPWPGRVRHGSSPTRLQSGGVS